MSVLVIVRAGVTSSSPTSKSSKYLPRGAVSEVHDVQPLRFERIIVQCEDRMPPSLCTSADLGALHLALAQAAAQLAHDLDDAEQDRAGRARVRVRQHAAVGVDRQRAADARVAILEERAALARLHEAQLLELDDRHDREAVVQLRHVDVLRAEPCHRVGRPPGLGRAEVREAGRAHDVLVRVHLADAQQVGGLVLHVHAHARPT